MSNSSLKFSEAPVHDSGVLEVLIQIKDLLIKISSQNDEILNAMKKKK